MCFLQQISELEVWSGENSTGPDAKIKQRNYFNVARSFLTRFQLQIFRQYCKYLSIQINKLYQIVYSISH